MALDEIIDKLGLGLYQIKNYILISNLMLFQVIQMLIKDFVAKENPFFCYFNFSESAIDEVIPLYDGETSMSNLEIANNVYSSCKMFSKNRTIIPCNNGYHHTFKKTITAEWDLVCDYSHLIPLFSSIFMAGCVFGAVVFSILSDKFGRKRILYFSTAGYSVLSILASTAPNYSMLLTLRFGQGFCHSGNFVLHIVMLSELLPKKYRFLIPILATVAYGLGFSVLALIAFFVRPWRTLQAVTGLLLGTYFIQTFFIDESIYWLVDNGKPAQARELILKAARWNAITLPKNFEEHLIVRKKSTLSKLDKTNDRKKMDYECNKAKESTHTATLSDLFTHKLLWPRTFNVDFGTFFMSQTYMGLTFATHKLPGNLYVNYTLVGLTEIPGKVLALIAIKLGRRKPVFIMNSLCILLLLSQLFLPYLSISKSQMDYLVIILFMASRCLIGASLTLSYVIINETFPTSIRNTAFGLNNSLTRMGYLFSPFIVNLNKIHPMLMAIVLSTSAMISAFLFALLPPTKDIPLPETLEDLERNNPFILPKYGPFFKVFDLKKYNEKYHPKEKSEDCSDLSLQTTTSYTNDKIEGQLNNGKYYLNDINVNDKKIDANSIRNLNHKGYYDNKGAEVSTDL